MVLPTPKIEPVCYEFGPFRLDPVRRELRKDGKAVPIAAKSFDLLETLVKNPGQSVTKEEFKQKVWPESKEVPENTFNVTLYNTRKALGESAKDHHYIVRTSGGYRFVVDVRKVPANSECESKEANATTQGMSAEPGSFLGGHIGHVLAACGIYAGLYSNTLFLEIAYEFDRYGASALKIAPWVFCWIAATSVAGLTAGWKQTLQGRSNGLVLCSLGFLFATLLLFAVLVLFLPSVPITQMKFPAHTAQAAYLKDVCYFVPLAWLFVITPFHFVVAMQREITEGRGDNVFLLLAGDQRGIRPKGTFYVKASTLLVILVLIAVYSLIARSYVLDNLIPARHTNLFEIFFYVRMFLIFGLAIYCLAWYSRALNELKRECLMKVVWPKPISKQI